MQVFAHAGNPPKSIEEFIGRVASDTVALTPTTNAFQSARLPQPSEMRTTEERTPPGWCCPMALGCVDMFIWVGVGRKRCEKDVALCAGMALLTELTLHHRMAARYGDKPYRGTGVAQQTVPAAA